MSVILTTDCLFLQRRCNAKSFEEIAFSLGHFEHFVDAFSDAHYVCRGKRGDYQNCSVLYCVLKLCSAQS